MKRFSCDNELMDVPISHAAPGDLDAHNAWIKSVLSKYNVSWLNGFLPENEPLVCWLNNRAIDISFHNYLPKARRMSVNKNRDRVVFVYSPIFTRPQLQFSDPYFSIWDDIVKDLTNLIAKQQLRHVVKDMPLLDHTRLGGLQEWERAYMVLSAIGNGYVWQNGEKEPAKVIPKCVAIPWVAVAERMGGNPILAHCNAVLTNWKITDKRKPLDVSNVDTQFSFTGDKGEHWFFMVTMQLELEAAPGIRSVVAAQKAVKDNDSTLLETSLISMKHSIDKLKVTLNRMSERCDPEFFYTKLRLFLAGWKNNKTLPDGIIYEGVSTKPLQFSGGSAAESSIFQTFDAALGIVHLREEGGKPSFLEGMMDYMPRSHREFILFLRSGPSIREYVKNRDNEHLKKVYNDCVESLEKFRSFHIQVVTRYITIQAAKEKHNNVTMLAEHGTGGTGIMPFLKTVRGDTVEAKIKFGGTTRTDT